MWMDGWIRQVDRPKAIRMDNRQTDRQMHFTDPRKQGVRQAKERHITLWKTPQNTVGTDHFLLIKHIIID
jgi:hypothetical protein